MCMQTCYRNVSILSENGAVFFRFRVLVPPKGAVGTNYLTVFRPSGAHTKFSIFRSQGLRAVLGEKPTNQIRSHSECGPSERHLVPVESHLQPRCLGSGPGRRFKKTEEKNLIFNYFCCSSENDKKYQNVGIFFPFRGLGAPYRGPVHRKDGF